MLTQRLALPPSLFLKPGLNPVFLWVGGRKAENQSAEQTSEASTRSLTSVGDRYRVTVCLLRLATRAQHSKPSPVEHSF